MCGALKRARLVHPGVAEVVFVKKEDAITAYKKYNNRCLDGKFEAGVEGGIHESIKGFPPRSRFQKVIQSSHAA